MFDNNELDSNSDVSSKIMNRDNNEDFKEDLGNSHNMLNSHYRQIFRAPRLHPMLHECRL